MLDALTNPDSVLQALPEAAVLLDPHQDRIVAANKRAIALLEISDSTSLSFSSLIGGELPNFLVFVDEIAHRKEAWTRNVRISSCTGKPLRCELRGTLADESKALLLTLIDLDELDRHEQATETANLHRSGLSAWKRAEGFFTELERQNQLILNAAGEGIYGINAEGKCTFVNRAAQEMLGWTAEDLYGREIHSVMHHHHLNGDVYHAHDCPIYRSFRFEQVHRIEDEVFWRKDGRPIRVEYVSTPIYDQQVLAGAVVIFRDITERKENEQKLRAALDQIEELRDRLEQENAYLQEAIISERAHHDIIGTSPAVQQLLAKIELVSKTNANVMITGEAGTGKALVASALHKDSERRRRPLIHFKCGSVAADATDAELFGQMRGAFPGALRDKPGKLELAHGGTLFLDDITELPLDTQGQLLDALQRGKVRRLGALEPRDIDIRLMSASSADLEREVAAGRFREDLYFHLNVFPIHCTPLRDRPDDIPALANHLLDIACKRLSRRKPRVTEAVMSRLMSYQWPGNVRELRNVIERAAIVSTGDKLILELSSGATLGSKSVGQILTDAEMQGAMRSNIVAALRATKGKVSGRNGAAELLALQPTTLYSRIKKLNITPSDWT